MFNNLLILLNFILKNKIFNSISCWQRYQCYIIIHTMSSKNIEKESNKKNINIKYLAKIAGVSPSTVSRALRKDPNANKKTAERILKIAKELNYYPNLLAKGLRDKKSKTIGIILNDLKNPYYYETLKIIVDKRCV